MNTELDDRLRALGTHLDAERTAHSAATDVVPVGTRRRTTVPMVLTVAASVVVIAGIVATMRSPDDPDRIAPATAPPSTPTSVFADTTVPATTEAPTTTSPDGLPAGVGTMNVAFQLSKNDDASRARAVAAMQAWVATLGLDATVTVDDQLHVVVRKVSAAYVAEIQQLLGDLQYQVQLRPVLKECTEPADLPPPYDASNYESILLLPMLTGQPPATPTPAQSVSVSTALGCRVGPSSGDGTVFAGDATSSPLDGGGTAVSVSLRAGAAGEDVWNSLATHCYDGDDVCPTHQMAIELGGQIYSVATVLTPTFTGSVQLSGGYDGEQLKALLQIMNHGPADVGLQVRGVGWTIDR